MNHAGSDPKRSARWVGLLFVLLCALGFLGMVAVVHWTQAPHWELGLLADVGALRQRPVTQAALLVTQIGGGWVMTALTILLVAALWSLGWRYSAQLALVMAVVPLLVRAAKELFARSRPPADLAVYHAGGYALPSGHSLAVAAFALTLWLIARRARPRWSRGVALGGLLLVVSVSATRPYLGVHYPSDVLAGWFLAGAWVLLVASLFPPRAPPEGGPPTPELDEAEPDGVERRDSDGRG